MNNDNTEAFWSEAENGKLSLNNYNFKMFLEANHFSKNKPNENSGFNLIKKNGIFLEIKDEYELKDYVLNYILENNLGQKAFNLMSGRTSIFKRDFLSMIKSEKIEVLRDTKDTSYLFYKNGVVEVNKDNAELKPYNSYGLSIWEQQVIKRDYIQTDHHECEYRTFIWKIAGECTKRYATFQSVIGYLLHSYNAGGDNKAIILNDELISDDPNGRSGKGLFCNGIKHLKKVQSLDGKAFRFDSGFPYQSVKTDCQVLVWDDVRKNFPFINLFSVITEGIELTYKGKDTIKLPIEDSPKIVITTNYTIKGNGGSFEARKFEVELSPFFNAKYTPIHFFKHKLFDDWDGLEWARFDSYMIECLKKYLSSGLIPYESISLPYKQLEADISKELFECIKTLKNDEWISIKDFIERYKGFVSKMSDMKTQNSITIAIKKYAEFFNLKYDSLASNGVMKFMLTSAVVDPKTLDIWDQIEREHGI